MKTVQQHGHQFQSKERLAGSIKSDLEHLHLKALEQDFVKAGDGPSKAFNDLVEYFNRIETDFADQFNDKA